MICFTAWLPSYCPVKVAVHAKGSNRWSTGKRTKFVCPTSDSLSKSISIKNGVLFHRYVGSSVWCHRYFTLVNICRSRQQHGWCLWSRMWKYQANYIHVCARGAAYTHTNMNTIMCTYVCTIVHGKDSICAVLLVHSWVYQIVLVPSWSAERAPDVWYGRDIPQGFPPNCGDCHRIQWSEKRLWGSSQ